MSILTSRQILKQSLLSEQRRGPVEFTSIDQQKPFIPERFTQLYHTPLYQALTDEQRLLYNQLCGVSGNEHFTLFESGFTNRVITRLARHPLVRRDPQLEQCLQIMLQEELRHGAMFRQLNQLSMPQLYNHQAYYFTRLSRVENLLLWCLTHIPRQLIFMLWLVLIVEEHSNHISRTALSPETTASLGALESNYVQAHRIHLQDEARHVHIDALLLDLFISRAGRASRKVNAVALKSLLVEIITPKRAGTKVIRMLARQRPELAAQLPDLLNAVGALKIDPGFALTLAQTANRPLSNFLQQSYPEFFFELQNLGLQAHA